MPAKVLPGQRLPEGKEASPKKFPPESGAGRDRRRRGDGGASASPGRPRFRPRTLRKGEKQGERQGGKQAGEG